MAEDKINNDNKEMAFVMPTSENLFDVTELFKTLGDETRTKILSVLANGNLCVCDIANLLKMTKSAISHQLKILKLARLVKSEKKGKEVFYIFKIYQMALEHVME